MSTLRTCMRFVAETARGEWEMRERLRAGRRVPYMAHAPSREARAVGFLAAAQSAGDLVLAAGEEARYGYTLHEADASGDHLWVCIKEHKLESDTRRWAKRHLDPRRSLTGEALFARAAELLPAFFAARYSLEVSEIPKASFVMLAPEVYGPDDLTQIILYRAHRGFEETCERRGAQRDSYDL